MSDKKPSILLVEDEYLPGIHLKTMLVREGHEVYGPAASADEAIGLAKSKKPDVILMDIRLAGAEDGIETARTIRDFCDAALIFMSGYQERVVREKAMTLSPLAFLVKPVMLRDIKAILARYEAPGSSSDLSSPK
jgi:DNA-binding NarL/FixJ family response regulator